MIVVDTNILVRYAVKDDRRQTIAATEFLRKNSALILKTVLLELVWVLSSASGYNLERAVVVERLHHVCGLPTITVEDASDVKQAIDWFERGMDFADALHLASSTPHEAFATMDKRLISKAARLADTAKVLFVA